MTHILFASSHAGVDLLPVEQTFHLKSPPDGKVFPAATPSSSKIARSRVPSHLYRKGQIYYFRFVLPRVMQKELGGVEIRLSLRTAYLREAKILADRLYLAMTDELQKTPLLSLPEIKKRLAMLVAKLAEQQAATAVPRPEKDHQHAKIGQTARQAVQRCCPCRFRGEGGKQILP